MDVFDRCKNLYNCCPDQFNWSGLGAFAALSRMAFEDRLCNAGSGVFVNNIVRQFLVSVAAIAIAAGILDYYHLSGAISYSIMLIVAFFSREIFTHGKEVPGEIMRRWKKKDDAQD